MKRIIIQEPLGQVLGEDNIGYAHYKNLEINSGQFSRYNKQKRTQSIEESNSRQYHINKKLLDEIKRKLPLYPQNELSMTQH